MTRHPNDPWFPVAALLVVLLVTWIGVAGPILDDATAKGLYGFVKDWQILITATIAISTAAIAWHNVTRQLRMAAKIREEDRMEAALPGLREADDLLVPLLSELRLLQGKENADQIVGARFNSPTENFTALARRTLPHADERMRREVAGMMLLLRVRSQQLVNAHSERERASRELADISSFRPEDHDKLRQADEAIVLHTRSMEEAINSLERLVMTYNERTARYVELLFKFRRQIEAFWDKD
jgi:hypothetical protein